MSFNERVGSAITWCILGVFFTFLFFIIFDRKFGSDGEYFPVLVCLVFLEQFILWSYLYSIRCEFCNARIYRVPDLVFFLVKPKSCPICGERV